MAEVAYNNAKNASSGYLSFMLNCGYYPHVFLEDKVDYHLKFHSTDKLAQGLRELMSIC